MRVGIVTESGEADSVRGIGVYTRELFKELKNLKVIVDLINKADPKLEMYDILHYPDFRVYFSNPRIIEGVKTVVTIHDVIPLIYPKQYPSGIKGKFRLLQQKLLLKKVDKVITVSETSKKDIVRLLGVNANKIKVIYEAPRDLFDKISLSASLQNEIIKKYKLPKKFVLYVGDVNYNKDISTLINACNRAGIALVIAGKHATEIESLSHELISIKGPRDWLRFLLGRPHPEIAHYENLTKLLKNKNILRLGFISDADLKAMFKLASVYCQPSFYEGFGLSVLEAMASGTPVIITKTQALVEVAADAAYVADPGSAKDFADKITEVLKDNSKRKQLIMSGYKRSEEFSWKKTAKETSELYQKVYSQ